MTQGTDSPIFHTRGATSNWIQVGILYNSCMGGHARGRREACFHTGYSYTLQAPNLVGNATDQVPSLHPNPSITWPNFNIFRWDQLYSSLNYCPAFLKKIWVALRAKNRRPPGMGGNDDCVASATQNFFSPKKRDSNGKRNGPSDRFPKTASKNIEKSRRSRLLREVHFHEIANWYKGGLVYF